MCSSEELRRQLQRIAIVSLEFRFSAPGPRIQLRNSSLQHGRGFVSLTAALVESPAPSALQAVATEAARGLTASPKALAPWLFYDATGSRLFEQITALPEYYLTRTERDIFAAHADHIFGELGLVGTKSSSTTIPFPSQLAIVELGAGTAAKTGILLSALARIQPKVLYQPIDISASALEEARAQLEAAIPSLTVQPCATNYVTSAYSITRPPRTRVLALYIGSSIGNFSPEEGRAILSRLRSQLQPGDALLLGTDLAPGATKPVAKLLAAYNDRAGVTAAFNRNMLARLNRELGANFRPDRFAHRAVWNAAESRIEMHLESIPPQRIHVPSNSVTSALNLSFAAGETIHTESSYKFSQAAIRALLASCGFVPTRTFTDAQDFFAVTLATVQ